MFFILLGLRDSRPRHSPPTICRFPYARRKRPSAMVYFHSVCFLFFFLISIQANKKMFFKTFGFIFQRAYRKRKKKIQNCSPPNNNPPPPLLK